MLLLLFFYGGVWAQSREQLEAIAKETGGGILVLQGGRERLILPSQNLKGVMEIDLSSPNLPFKLNEQKQFDQLPVRDELILFARELAAAGVRQRHEGNWPEACYLYRFSFHITLRFRQWDGVKAIASNLWVLREEIQHYVNGESVPMFGPEFKLAISQEQKDKREYFKKLLQLIRSDSESLLPEVENLVSKFSPRNTPQKLVTLECLRLMADLALKVDLRRATLLRMKAVTDSLNKRGAFNIALTQELSQATLFDFLSHEGLVREKDTGFNEIWHLYADHRKEVIETGDEREILGNLTNAYRSFTYQRSLAVRGGGSFGHRISYVISQFLQPIGRDIVYFLMKNGRPDAALRLAESTRARALGDWTARSHATNRLMLNPHDGGSVGEVMPATLDEIREAAVKVKAPILIYVADHSGYSVWLQSTDGKLFSAHIENPQQLLERMFKFFPYASSSGELGRGRRRARGAGLVGANEQNTLDDDLKSLYQALFPEEIRKVLKLEGERLIIIPDLLLNYVPFCALKTEDDKYLIEKYEIVYWPSVTTWLITETAAAQRKKGRLKDREGALQPSPVSALVIADPAFSGPRRVYFRGMSRAVEFDALPGTAREAKAIAELLKSDVFIGKDATRQKLMSARRDVPILHLATHGLLNEENPETSFVLFSDGILTARELYELAGAFQSELVMLSACQTGLGTVHTDSSIGLTNAFLVAGANTVGSTLWQIPDDASARLMTVFYTEVARGENLPAALRKAQLEVLKHTHWQEPSNWAAYKLLGRLENPLE
jgi:CHAT domain-containing protein